MKKLKLFVGGFLALAVLGFILQALGLAPKTETPETPKVATQSSTRSLKRRQQTPQKPQKPQRPQRPALNLMINYQR